MNCDQVSTLLEAYVDGDSIDAVAVREIEAHLARCPGCSLKFETLKANAQAIRETALYHKAPEHLLRNIGSIGAVEPKIERPAWDWRPRAWSFANLCVVAAAATIIVITLVGRRGESPRGPFPIDAELVSAHIRSLQANHLFDVLSTDQHTVKPWFQGKLDFSPSVPNLTSSGFPLVGGRLDYIGGRPTAALIYKRGKHIINVFVRPTPSDSETENGTIDGYHIVIWTSKRIEYSVVSDADFAALDEFSNAFRTAISQ